MLADGAAAAGLDHQALRSSPTPEGRCWRPAWQTGMRRDGCCDPTTSRAGLAGRGGMALRLRSSPTRRAGAGAASTGNPLRIAAKLRSSPTPEGRCWVTMWGSTWLMVLVAILTDPRAGAGPPHPRSPPHPRRCDPHRPRRAGAGTACSPCSPSSSALRSSPTPEGRCWGRLILEARRTLRRCDPHRPPRAGAGTACSPCSPSSSALRSSPTPGPVLAEPVPDPGPTYRVAILTDPGGPVLVR